MAQDASILPSGAPHHQQPDAPGEINAALPGTGVRVDVGNTWARITPGAVSEYFADELTITTTGFTTGGKHGYKACRRLERLFLHEQDAVSVRAGLVPLVVERLRAKGLQVTARNRYNLDPRAAPHPQVLGASAGDRDFLATLAREPRGLIETSSGAELVQRLALMAQLFPLARMMIAMNGSRATQRQLRRDLQRAGAGKVHLLQTYDWPWQGGRLLCHLGQFAASTEARDRDFDVVVVANAFQAVAPAYHEALLRLNMHRVYGFLPCSQPLTRRNCLELQALVGPLLWRSPARAAAPVTVYWCQPPWTPRLASVNALQRKRIAYWHNDARNALIAKIARAVRVRDLPALWDVGLFLETALLGSRKPDVTVLVESPEHGRALHQRLPDWTLRDGVPLAPGARADFSWDWWHDANTIRTYVLAHRLGAVYADVLVWAGPESPALLPRLAQDWRGVDPVALIDIADDVDEQAREASRRRLRSYEEHGWSSVGVPRWMLHEEEQHGCGGVNRSGSGPERQGKRERGVRSQPAIASASPGKV
jgi:hypothetical protein